MNSWTRRIITTIVSLAILFGQVAQALSSVTQARLTTAAPTAPQRAAAATLALVINAPTGVLHCSIGSCSYYYNRHWTRWIADHVYWAGAAAAAFSAVPYPGTKVAAAALAASTLLMQGKAREAAKKNQCLRVRFRHGGLIIGMYASGNRYCKN